MKTPRRQCADGGSDVIVVVDLDKVSQIVKVDGVLVGAKPPCHFVLRGKHGDTQIVRSLSAEEELLQKIMIDFESQIYCSHSRSPSDGICP